MDDARQPAAQDTQVTLRELKTANRELSEFRRLVESVRDYAIFMLDTDGRILSWNEGARHLKGYEADEIVGQHFSSFYTDADRARDHPANELRIAAREGRYEEEGWRVRKDGTTFWASVTITAVRDDGGGVRRFAKVTRDLTERKLAEDALQRAVEDLRRANAELDRFASVAAHDMTDPLRTISGFAEILVETDPAPDEARQYAQHIFDSSLRLTGMLRGLLAYARAGRPSEAVEAVDLAAVAGQVVEDLAGPIRERAARVTTDVPADARVAADAHDVRVALQNLVSNAVKFADATDPSVAIAATAARAGWWRVTVEDNGAGVSAEEQTTIFNAFERASGASGHAGYGLGLAICQRLAERHGGRIGIESQPGAGCRFWLTIPAA